MKYLQDTSWQEIWGQWKTSEQEVWKRFYTEKGFFDWESWRKSYFQNLHPEIFEWKLFELETREILHLECGAFPKWMEISKQTGSRYFRDLAQNEIFSQLEKIALLKEHLPPEIQLIGFKKGSHIILFEGHHRCIAICQMIQEQIPVKSHITIAIAEVDEQQEYPLIDY